MANEGVCYVIEEDVLRVYCGALENAEGELREDNFQMIDELSKWIESGVDAGLTEEGWIYVERGRRVAVKYEACPFREQGWQG